MSSLWAMDDIETHDNEGARDRPGVPLKSGFHFRPALDAPDARLSPEARGRVFEKMESVAEARMRAAKDGHTAYVG